MAMIKGHQIIAKALKTQGVENMYGVVGIPVVVTAYSAQRVGINYVVMRHEMPATYRRPAVRRISDAHYRLGLAAVRDSDFGRGRSHLWRSLKAWPLKWRACVALASTFLPKGAALGERTTRELPPR